MIRDRVPRFLKRVSDYVLPGRNRSRIVLGTDRKNTANSGYGDGGKNDTESSSIDLVAGFVKEDPAYKEDKSRVYIAEKTDPDDYFGIEEGPKATGESAVVVKSGNVYIAADSKVKIIHPNFTLVVTSEGVEIKATKIKMKAGDGTLEILQDGTVNIGSDTGIPKRILTEGDIGIVSSTGQCSFLVPGAQIFNNKVRIK